MAKKTSMKRRGISGFMKQSEMKIILEEPSALVTLAQCESNKYFYEAKRIQCNPINTYLYTATSPPEQLFAK